jgi:hypothetical protein
MRKADYILADKIISHQLYLSRFTAGEQKKILKLLLAMQTELKSKLSNGFTDYSKARMLKMLNECRMVINEYYKQMQAKINYSAVAETELKATQKVFAAISVEAAIPTSTAMKALVSDVLIEGSPAASWWAKQAADTAFRFAAQVRQGVAQNETVAQVVTRIVGSKKYGTPGIMDISRRNAYALVHTSIQQISNDARMATFQENADILEGMEQVSTLDSHTTAVCMAYSGQQWNLDGNPINGSELPYNGGCPRHYNCRSVIVPLLIPLSKIAGVELPKKPEGTRASDLGQIKESTTFNAFLQRHSDEYVNEMLGKGRADMWREGKITLTDLVSGQGRELTLSELKAKYN